MTTYRHTQTNCLKIVSFYSPAKAIVLIGSIILFCMFFNLAAADNDSKLIDEYIQSLGYRSFIEFNSSNIKQFWVDKTVSSDKNTINIVLESTGANNYESVPLRIQLMNVLENQDCKIDVLTENSDVSFFVINDQKKTISGPTEKEQFVQNSIVSSTFHLEDTRNLTFYMCFSAPQPSLSIKKIILSFSDNKNSSFFLSPGVLSITKNDVTLSNSKLIDSPDFAVCGVYTKIFSNKKIFTENNTLTSSVKIKNLGSVPTKIYFGYSSYLKNGDNLKTENYPYKNINKILTVVSANKGSNIIVVDDYPEWETKCHIALNVKDDLSDIPNTNILNGTILEIKKLKNGQGEITLDQLLKESMPQGSKIRIHGAFSGNLYPATKVLQPNEEAVLSATIKKDDTFLAYSSKAFSRNVYYVVPLIYSYSTESNVENTIIIEDFSISY